ncbi:MAG TPA: uL15m family ribosomal protein, partial [Reyranella sp.]
LVKSGAVRRERDGIRLIGGAGFSAKKVTFKVAHATKGALAAIEAAGGKVDMPKAKEEATTADA